MSAANPIAPGSDRPINSSAMPKATKLEDFVAHAGNVNCVSIGRHTAKILATGGDDKTVNIWGVGKPNCLHRLTGLTSAVEAVRFDINEAVVVGGSASGSLRLWDLTNGKTVRTLSGHKSNIRSVDFHPYGDFIASGSLDTSLKVWDVRRKGCIQAYKGHEDVINCIRFSPDGRWIISGSEDRSIKLWDLAAGKMLHEFKHHTGAVTTLEFHPSEFLLASGSSDRTVKFWDLETFSPAGSTSIEASRIRAVSFAEDGQCLFSGGQDCMRAYGWEPSTCYESMSIGWGKIQDMAVCPGTVMAASCSTNVVSLWKVDVTGVPENSHPEDHKPVPTAPVIPPAQQRPSTTSNNRSYNDAPREYEAPAAVPRAPAAVPKSRGSLRDARQATPEYKPAAVKSVPRAPGARSSTPVSHEQAPAPVTDSARPASRRESASQRAPAPAPPTAHAVVAAPDQNETVIPTNRDRPMGLNMQAFLPAVGAVPVNTAVDEDKIFDSVQTGHESMLTVMATRLRNLKVVQRKWADGNHQGAVDMMLELGDQAVIVDMMSIMIQTSSIWTLNIAVTLLPKCQELLCSQYENYIEAGSAATQLVLKNFGHTISSNIKSPPAPGGVDISREERYEKCVACKECLMSLRQAIQPRLSKPGKVGSQLRLLDKGLRVVA